MAYRGGMRVMIVVPALAEGEDCYQPVVGRKVLSGKAARAPQVGGGIDRPGGMETEHDAQENSPQHPLPSADGEQDKSQDDKGNVVVFRDPDMEFVFSEIRNVARQGGGVVVHGASGEDPAHMGPPFSINRGMRIARDVGQLMMNAVGSYPENRSAFQGQRAANSEEILDPFGS